MPVSMTEASPPIDVRISDDRIRVLLSCGMPAAGPAALVPLVEEHLTRIPFAVPPNPDDWKARLLQAPVAGHIHELVLVEGTPPVPPQHGRVEWTDDFFSTGYLLDPATDRVDYRQRAANTSVEAEQRIGIIVPPVDGEDGVDALGRRIPVEKARPARIRAGANVRLNESEGVLYATATGRIRLKDNVVSVDETFTIEGNVGLETGNIRHPGNLVIHGDIEADSTVEATGDIEVTGVVEPSTVIAGGDLIVHGGITGDVGKRIVAGGNVRAKFIVDAYVEAGGAVIVESEIIQSHIQTGGALSCPRGRVVGGKIEAQGGAEVMQTGTAAGILTVFVAGEDIELRRKLAACDERMVEWRKQHDRICQRIDPIKAHEDRLEGPALDALHKLEQQIKTIEAEMSSIQNEKRGLREDSKAQCRPQIYIYGHAHAETFLSVGGEKMRLTETLNGPVCIELKDYRVHIRLLHGHERDGKTPRGAGALNRMNAADS